MGFVAVPELAEIAQDSDFYPAELSSFFDKEPPRLWYAGDPSIMRGTPLGIISARKIEPDLALKSSKLLHQLAFQERTFISGWHSPLEEEALRILMGGNSRIIFCLSKSLNRFDCSTEIDDLVNTGRALLLTHCSPRARRISRDASLRRNQLVAALATGLLVLSAPTGSASFKLANVAISLGKPVFTPQHRINDGLLACGASAAAVENIQRVFQ